MFNEGQEIPLTNTNAYAICQSGQSYAITVRMANGHLYKIKLTRLESDPEGTLRAKSNFSEDHLEIPVAELTQIPGIPVDVATTGDMITGTVTFTTHPEEPEPETEP